MIFSFKGTIHKIPKLFTRTLKTDYLLSRRRIIVGDNPTISLTAFVYFLSVQVSSIKSELVQEQEPKLGTPNFCINKWRHPWDHTLRTQD